MFRGIDNDEAVFLEFASKQQAEMDGRRFAVTAEVKEFRVSFFNVHGHLDYSLSPFYSPFNSYSTNSSHI